MPLSSHASRWLVALILGPVLIWIITAGPPLAFFLVVTLAGLVAWWEFASVFLAPNLTGLKIIGLAGTLLIMAGARMSGAFHLAALFPALGAGFAYFVLKYEKIPSIMDQAGRFALGLTYAVLLLSFFIPIFSLPYGRVWVLFTLLVTFLSDTSAYYAGRTWGRRPLHAAVSPKKTMEGLWGGVIGGGLAGAVTGVFLPPVTWYEAGGVALFLSLWGVMGDLFESVLKRSAGVKDSGGILMGHGGLLDRVDALVFNVPLVYIFAWIVSP
ncbi:MAG: phosphatidate cytidylyltransferase [Proteobacteria bacterium]|nr:phosphatidate cytidylyltransferase [Pseudomonadota bacterium]